MNFRSMLVTLCCGLAALISVVSGVQAQENGVPVLGPFEFGDSQTEVRLKTLQDDFFPVPMENRGEHVLSPRGEVDLRIGDVNLDLLFFFNKAGLHRMDAVGEPLSPDQFDSTLTERRKVLQEVLVRVFDDPTFTRTYEPDEFEDGEFRATDHWSSDRLDAPKEIWLGYNRRGDQFQLYLIIQDPDRSDAPAIEDTDPSPPTLDLDEAENLFSGDPFPES